MGDKPYYLAGPMTGYPQFNFPLFHSAAAALRTAGYDIISPAEQDSPAVQAAAIASKTGAMDSNGKIAGETWGEILARDVRIVSDQIQGVIFLPDWAKSRGARLEAFVALLCKHTQYGFYTGANPLVAWVPSESIAASLRAAL